MGVRKTTDFLEKATWTLGIALLIFSVISSSLIGGPAEVISAESELTDEANQVIIPQSQAPLIQEGFQHKKHLQALNPKTMSYLKVMRTKKVYFK